MAHGQRRIRTVSVRLRCAMTACVRSSTVRRLLLIAGVAVAGWLLLGGAGQARADAAAGPAADSPGAVLGTTSDLTGVPGGRASVPGASSLPRKVTGDLTRSACEVRCTALPVRSSTVLDPQRGIERIVADLAPTRAWSDRTDTGVSWTPRHHGAGADAADRTGAQAFRPHAASGASEGDRLVDAAAMSHPAPPPWRHLPGPSSPQAGAFLPAAGSALTGGGLAHLPWARSMARVPHIRVPVPDAVLPPMHSAADEPALSPD